MQERMEVSSEAVHWQNWKSALTKLGQKEKLCQIRKYLHSHGSLIFMKQPRTFTLYGSWEIAQWATDNILQIMLGLMQFFLIWKKM